MVIPDREACASASACGGAVWELDLAGGAIEGGGAGGLGSGPLFPLLTGRDAPMRKLVPAHNPFFCFFGGGHACQFKQACVKLTVILVFE